MVARGHDRSREGARCSRRRMRLRRRARRPRPASRHAYSSHGGCSIRSSKARRDRRRSATGRRGRASQRDAFTKRPRAMARAARGRCPSYRRTASRVARTDLLDACGQVRSILILSLNRPRHLMATAHGRRRSRRGPRPRSCRTRSLRRAAYELAADQRERSLRLANEVETALHEHPVRMCGPHTGKTGVDLGGFPR